MSTARSFSLVVLAILSASTGCRSWTPPVAPDPLHLVELGQVLLWIGDTTHQVKVLEANDSMLGTTDHWRPSPCKDCPILWIHVESIDSIQTQSASAARTARLFLAPLAVLMLSGVVVAAFYSGGD